MAADVSSLSRMLNGFNEEQHQPAKIEENSSELITRDLLGSCSRAETKELDLDLQVPNGWEKRLDLKSGSVYLQKCRSSSFPSLSKSSDQKNHHHQQQRQHQNRMVPELHDLNLPPPSSSNKTTSSSKTLLLEFEKRLDLKLVTSYDYQSVCTLDMVKSALERADKKKNHLMQKRSCSSLDGSSSSSSSLTLLKEEEEEKRSSSTSSSQSSSSLFAAGCSNCLMYVLMSKTNPKCPRCDAIVPSPTINKKPRIDLNTFSD